MGRREFVPGELSPPAPDGRVSAAAERVDLQEPPLQVRKDGIVQRTGDRLLLSVALERTVDGDRADVLDVSARPEVAAAALEVVDEVIVLLKELIAVEDLLAPVFDLRRLHAVGIDEPAHTNPRPQDARLGHAGLLGGARPVIGGATSARRPSRCLP